VKSEWNLVIQVASMNEEPMTAQREDANPRRAVCGESRMHGSEGGVGKHSSAVRPAPTLPKEAGTATAGAFVLSDRFVS
jgi:hypothetical protein